MVYFGFSSLAAVGLDASGFVFRQGNAKFLTRVLVNKVFFSLKMVSFSSLFLDFPLEWTIFGS